jgi:hypothetical protein
LVLDERERKNPGVKDLACEIGPHRVLLSEQDVTDLDEWFLGDPSGREQLHEPLKRALETGGDLIVRDDHVRSVLLAVLDQIDDGGLIVTPGLRRLHEIARLPIIAD